MERKNFIRIAGISGLAAVCSKPLNLFGMTNEKEDITIRIHHFYDIIRDFATQEKIEANLNYKHSYHTVGERIRVSPDMKMKIVVGIDSVCDGCIHLVNGACDDTLKKPGFPLKNDYNNYLDKRILKATRLKEGMIVTPKDLCIAAEKYLDKMFSIYEINDKADTEKRKAEVIQGLQYYSKKNGFELKFLS